MEHSDARPELQVRRLAGVAFGAAHTRARAIPSVMLRPRAIVGEHQVRRASGRDRQRQRLERLDCIPAPHSSFASAARTVSARLWRTFSARSGHVGPRMAWRARLCIAQQHESRLRRTQLHNRALKKVTDKTKPRG